MASNETSFIHPEKFWRDVGLRAGQVVAHLGCGAGFYAVPAAQIVGKAGQVIGVDIRSDMLAETQSRAVRAGVADPLRLIRANLENDHGSTLPDNQVDWALIANVLHQADPQKLLPEAARIIKQTGTVVVAEWDTATTPLGPPAGKRIAKDEVLTIAAGLGLQLMREFTPSPYHYGLLFHKT